MSAQDRTRKLTLEQWAGASSGRLTQLTLVFTDIISSTALCSAMGDRKWIEMLIKHFAHARALLLQFECYEIKIIGDSFMVAFKNAIDAINFAIGFMNDTGDEQIKIRAGIHAGAARIIGNDLYGGMVNYAARVTGWQREEGIALSETAKDQIENEKGTIESRSLFIRVSHNFPDYDEPKILWRVNCSDYWDQRIRQQFPRLEELARLDGYTEYLIVPATAADIKWFAEIEIEAYGLDAVPLEVLEQWYERNPTGFFTIKASDGSRVGHLDVLALRPDALGSLLEGDVAERDIQAQDLYAPNQKRLIKDLYVESIIIAVTDPDARGSVIYVILSEFERLIGRVCDVTRVEKIYAIAATSSGDKFMRHMGFQQVRSSEQRTDHHPFFAARYSDIAVNIGNILGR